MLKEFREFAMKGNVVDLAVGVIIGAAFGGIVTSLVGDIFMPIIGAVTGGLRDVLACGAEPIAAHDVAEAVDAQATASVRLGRAVVTVAPGHVLRGSGRRYWPAVAAGPPAGHSAARALTRVS